MHPFTPYILSVIRIVAGLMFVQHGLEKLFGFAGAVVFLYFAAAGAGAWSLDARTERRRAPSGAWEPSA